MTRWMTAAVRELKKEPWWSTKKEEDKGMSTPNNDLMNVEIDAATVTETIVAFAEMQSKRTHKWVMLFVLICAALAGFSDQIVRLLGKVR
eukprot:COSAG02_NODE_3112_length_7339_cov_13.532182_3_plen_90_part_00